MAPVFPVLAPVAVYPYQATPAAWGTSSYPHQSPAAVPSSPGGLLDDCDGYAQMAPIADYSALLNSRMLAAHIYQNLGNAARKYGMRVGLELATIMYRNATRLEPTERELRVLEMIVARYIGEREAAPTPNDGGEARRPDRPGHGRTVTVVVPPDVDIIRIEIGDASPKPPKPRPKPPKPKPNPPTPKPDPDDDTPKPPVPEPAPDSEPEPEPDGPNPPDDGGGAARPKGPGEKVL